MRTYFYIAFMMVFFISMAVNCKPQSFAADGVNTGNRTTWNNKSNNMELHGITWFLDLNHTHTHKDQPEKRDECLQPGTVYREDNSCFDKCHNKPTMCKLAVVHGCYCAEGTCRNDAGQCVPNKFKYVEPFK